MKIRRSFLLACSLLLSIAGAAQEAGNVPYPVLVEIKVHYKYDRWIMAPPVADDSGTTHSVILSVIRAVDPQTGLPFDTSEPELAFDPKDLHHSFRLEKSEFLLGEPILVEHRIELNGPGQWDWFVGGNYRARGRDDNFSFVLRHADGRIVPDVYPKLEGVIMGGGLGSEREINKNKHLSYWLGLQRYSAITEPGLYDLYCMTGGKQKIFGEVKAIRAALPETVARDHYLDDSGRLIDRETNAPSKRYQLLIYPQYLDSDEPWPLKGLIPPEVTAYAAEQSSGTPLRETESFGTVAHFRIRISKGTRAEQQQMVEQRTKTAESLTRRSTPTGYERALLEALWYSRQDQFLPLLEKWITNHKGPEDFTSPSLHLDGLAMRPDSAAFALLLKSSPSEVSNAFYSLHPDRIAEAIPICIGWLTHPDDQVRARSESRLVAWTGQSFERTWDNYHYQRPTLAEGVRMQPLWRAWWEKNKRTFKPRKPCRFPCEKTETQNNEAR
jgi:hypothetical protein